MHHIDFFKPEKIVTPEQKKIFDYLQFINNLIVQ